VPLRNVEQNKGGEPGTEKYFETQHSGVFAPPGLPLAHFQLRNPGSIVAAFQGFHWPTVSRIIPAGLRPRDFLAA
jgi:hypothetical protein